MSRRIDPVTKRPPPTRLLSVLRQIEELNFAEFTRLCDYIDPVSVIGCAEVHRRIIKAVELERESEEGQK